MYDDTIIGVHGYLKQDSANGCSRVRGLNLLIATTKTVAVAPFILAQRSRRGPCWSRRGADRFIQDALATRRRLVVLSYVGVSAVNLCSTLSISGHQTG